MLIVSQTPAGGVPLSRGKENESLLWIAIMNRVDSYFRPPPCHSKVMKLGALLIDRLVTLLEPQP